MVAAKRLSRLLPALLASACALGSFAAPARAVTGLNSAGKLPNDIVRIDPKLLELYTTNAGNASPIWKYVDTKTDGKTDAIVVPENAMAIGSDGTIYLGLDYWWFATLPALIAVSPDGQKLWEYDAATPADWTAPPVVGPDGAVYAATGNAKYGEGVLDAVAAGGKRRWSADVGAVTAPPVFGPDGTVYAGSADGVLHALRPEDGSEKWSSSPGYLGAAYMAVGTDGTIYVGNDGDTFVAVKPNGSVKWTFKAGGKVNTAPVIGADGTIYVGADDHKLYALAPNGTKKFEYRLGGAPLSLLLGADGNVYASASDAAVYALRPDGAQLWKTAFHAAAGRLAAGPNGTIHALTEDGMLQTLNTADGSLQWRQGTIASPVRLIHPAAVPDGTVYAAGTDASNVYLFAFRVRIDGIALNTASLQLQPGASGTLTASLMPANAPDRAVAWSSSKPGVASVDANGKVTAVSAGTATVTARTHDGGRTAVCAVTVTTAPGAVEVESVTVAPTTLSLAPGGSVQLTANLVPAEATNRKVAWSSSNPAAATVDANGKVTAVANGTAIVTAVTEDGGFSASSKVTVAPGDDAGGGGTTGTQPGTPANAAFADVQGHWAGADIARASELHIANGYPDGTFRPENPITRAEFAVMLMNGLRPDLDGASLTFKDKNAIAAWARQAVAQAVQLGAVGGYPDGTFRPGANITHAEMAAMVFKASGLAAANDASTPYADDASIPAWARSSVSAAEKNGIIVIGGRTEGISFAPGTLATRAEAAAWIVRMLKAKNGG